MSKTKKMIEALQTKHNPIILDCETTGLDPTTDEILELAIINTEGTVLYHSLVKPVRNHSWEAAAKIHGIDPEMIASAPLLSEELPKIQTIISGSDLIIGYNPLFDLAFLEEAGCDYSHLYDTIYARYWIEDLMDAFAAIYGDWNTYYGSYTWQKLSTAAAYYDFTWKEKEHSALGDCNATLHIWKAMCERGDLLLSYTKQVPHYV